MMSIFGDLGELPDSFDGRVRLFPLPDLVMFPHVIQPLHVFEPRYCELLRDALAGDQLIAMSLLKPGWQQEYEGSPQVERVVCVGRVVSHWESKDATSNILLLGLQRAMIQRELPRESLYREASVSLVEDVYPAHNAERRPQLLRELLTAFRSMLPAGAAAQEQFETLLRHQIPLGTLTDIIAFSLNLENALKQKLLAEWDVDRRATMLLEHLGAESDALHDVPLSPPRRYPLPFSLN